MEATARFHALLTDAHIRRFMMDGRVVDEGFARDAVEENRRERAHTGLGLWLLFERAGGELEPIGFAGFYRFQGEASPAELVYALREPYTGRGYAGESAQALIQFARERRLLDAIMTNVDEPNLASRRVLTRLGFRECGETKGAFGRVVHYTLPSDRPPLELRTERLLLRPFEDEDLAEFAALNADPRVMEFFPNMLSRAESDALASHIREHFAQHGYGVWSIEVAGVTRYAGSVGLNLATFRSRFTPAVELAYRIAAPYWGQNYAVEAARAALRVAFGQLRLAEVVAFTAVQNQRSQRVMQKLGMRRDEADDFDHPNLPAGHALRRHVLYRIAATSPGR